MRVDEQDPPQFSRLATLAGVTPPMTDREIQQSGQRQIRSQSKKERSSSKLEGMLRKEGSSPKPEGISKKEGSHLLVGLHYFLLS